MRKNVQTFLLLPIFQKGVGPHQSSADRNVEYHIFAIKESIPKESKNKNSQKFDFKYNFHVSSNICTEILIVKMIHESKLLKNIRRKIFNGNNEKVWGCGIGGPR